jgi:hypothetical protein
VSEGTRASGVVNATYRPSGLRVMAEGPEGPAAGWPVASRLTCSVVPLTRSRMNASARLFVSPGTRLAAEMNATYRPSPLSDRAEEGAVAWVPSDARLARTTAPVAPTAAAGPNEKAEGATRVVPRLVTPMSTRSTEWAAVMVRRFVWSTHVAADAVPPRVTLASFAKFSPRMVTTVPPVDGPDGGDTVSTRGACSGYPNA